MAEHRVTKNNIIYIIPDDELFEKYKNDEAFIDDYGRLMNRRPHRVLKELKHYAIKTPSNRQKSMPQSNASTRKDPSLANQIKHSLRKELSETTGKVINRTVDDVSEKLVDKLVYEGLPYIWHHGIVPLYDRVKDTLTSKGTKADEVLKQAKTSSEMVTVKPKSNTKLSQEEKDEESQKAFYHWLFLLVSLEKPDNAGQLDLNLTLTQLTAPANLEQINTFLSENRNLVEEDKYSTLHDLLGRDLYNKGQLIPIKAEEITTIGKTYEFKTDVKKQEDDNND